MQYIMYIPICKQNQVHDQPKRYNMFRANHSKKNWHFKFVCHFITYFDQDIGNIITNPKATNPKWLIILKLPNIPAPNITLQEINISHKTGKGKSSSSKAPFGGGYVSSQEGKKTTNQNYSPEFPN